MSGTYPPSGPQGPQGPQGPYGQGSGNEPPYGAQPNQPGQGGYGQNPGQGSGGFGNPPGSTGSGSSAPTYFGPGATQPMPQQQPGPYGQPSAGAPQGPVGPTGVYPSQPPGGPKKKSNGPLIGILAGAVGLIVVIAIILGVVLTRGNGNDPTGPGPSDPGSSAPTKATTQSDAVQGFLEAIAAGDSAKALTYAQTEPSDKTFLTDAVLAESKKTNPITDINVPAVSNEYTSLVSATYTLGKTKVTENFEVEKVADEYKLTDVANDIDLTNTRFDGLPMKINGVAVDSDEVLLFPGTYSVSTGLANIAYGKGLLTVKSPSGYASTSDLTPAITAAGKKAFVAAVKSAIDNCVKQKSLNPGCGLSVKPSNGKVTTSTIKWKVTRGGTLSGLDPRLDYDDPRFAKGYASVSVSFSARGTLDSGGSGTLETTRYISSVSGDVSKSSIKITFS